MGISVNERVRKRRESLRASGFKPIQIWIADSRAPGFLEECDRQVQLVNQADRQDVDLLDFLDAAAADLVDDDR